MDALLWMLVVIGAILALIAVRWIAWRVNVVKFHHDFTEWERRQIRGDVPENPEPIDGRTQ